ncbi:hypothetical protein [Myceligenerans xiligouense]|uniref:hypothetical protein n=1 Tax=Myceligenerans xiligouense TaxID=253184 RepID=UPI000F4DC729|nr:hypothetical protein [Myceligenerans xiligouense]
MNPDLRRVSVAWDDLSLPPYLRDVTEHTWHHLSALATPEADTPATYPAPTPSAPTSPAPTNSSTAPLPTAGSAD